LKLKWAVPLLNIGWVLTARSTTLELRATPALTKKTNLMLNVFTISELTNEQQKQ